MWWLWVRVLTWSSSAFSYRCLFRGGNQLLFCDITHTHKTCSQHIYLKQGSAKFFFKGPEVSVLQAIWTLFQPYSSQLLESKSSHRKYVNKFGPLASVSQTLEAVYTGATLPQPESWMLDFPVPKISLPPVLGTSHPSLSSTDPCISTSCLVAQLLSCSDHFPALRLLSLPPPVPDPHLAQRSFTFSSFLFLTQVFTDSLFNSTLFTCLPHCNFQELATNETDSPTLTEFIVLEEMG